jgi:regulator of PEP synthase PpsR (kinase-PPPase family)
MSAKKIVNIHLVSDSTGETLGSISRAVLSQFKDVESQEHMWTLVRTERQIKTIIDELKEYPGIVLYTILDKTLLEFLIKGCKENKIPCISALEQVIDGFSAYLGQKMLDKPGRQHILDEDYFERIEAINYTLTHDDGQKTSELDEADVILVGPSRTSKSPTCIYLSYRSLKAANVPFVKGIDLPSILFELKEPLIIGLTISPEILVQIRHNRLQLIDNITTKTDYIDMEKVREEIIAAKKIYAQNKWPIIDVSRRSVEETAASIVQMYKRRNLEKND